MIACILTLSGGTGLVLLGLGRTPGIRFAKYEEAMGEMESYFFPSQKIWMDALNGWEDRLHQRRGATEHVT